MPSNVRIKVDRMTSEQLLVATKYGENKCGSMNMLDPFYNSCNDEPSDISLDPSINIVQQVQPFTNGCTVSANGLYGSGPIALSYYNTMYIYPKMLDKFVHRNLAIKIELLAPQGKQYVPRKAIYASGGAFVKTAITEVTYHQRMPQLSDEIKIRLPLHVTDKHHLMITYFHVHCKTMKDGDEQQLAIGYSVFPLLNAAGNIQMDGDHHCLVYGSHPQQEALLQGKAQDYVSVLGYGRAKPSLQDTKSRMLHLKTRTISSVYCQDGSISAFLKLSDTDSNEDIQKHLLNLQSAGEVPTRFHLLPLMRQLCRFLSLSSTVEARSSIALNSFCSLLCILEKTSPQKQQNVESKELLQAYVDVIFDTNTFHQDFYRVLIVQWTNLLSFESSDKSQKPIMKSKKLSLIHAETLFALILQCIANNGTAEPQFPRTICADDESLLTSLVVTLVHSVKDRKYGLMLRKEVNNHLSKTIRKLFLVIPIAFGSSLFSTYLQTLDALENPEMLMNVLFPFLRVMVQFEYFVEINLSKRNQVEPGWLANQVFSILISVIASHSEDNLRREALTILRTLFVAHSFHPKLQDPAAQETVASMYLALFDEVFKVSCTWKIKHDLEDQTSHGSKREVLVCIGYILKNTSISALQHYWRPSSGKAYQRAFSGPKKSSSRSKTIGPLKMSAMLGGLSHVREIMEARKGLLSPPENAIMPPPAPPQANVCVAKLGEKERILSFVYVLQQMVVNFELPNRKNGTTSSAKAYSLCQALLSPDSSNNSSTRKTGNLQQLEAYIKKRNSRDRRRISVHQDQATSPRGNDGIKSRSGSASFGPLENLILDDSESNHIQKSNSLNKAITPDDILDVQIPISLRSLDDDNILDHGPTKPGIHRSLPHKWNGAGILRSKNEFDRKSYNSTSGEDRNEIEENAENLCELVYSTVLYNLRSLVSHFSGVFEVPAHDIEWYWKDGSKNNGDHYSKAEAYELMSACFNLFYEIISRNVSEHILAQTYMLMGTIMVQYRSSCFLEEQVPFFYEEKWCMLILQHCSAGKEYAVSFLGNLLEANFEILGSLSRVKKSIYSCFRSILRLLTASNAYLSDVCTCNRENLLGSFRHFASYEAVILPVNSIHGREIRNMFFRELNNVVATLRKMELCWHQYHLVLDSTKPAEVPRAADCKVDLVALEEMFCEIIHLISPIWLPKVRHFWLESLYNFHKMQKHYAEGAQCKLDQARCSGDTTIGNSQQKDCWEAAIDLCMIGNEHAMALETCKQIVDHQHANNDFLGASKTYDLMKQLSENLALEQNAGNANGFMSKGAFFKVQLRGQLVQYSSACCEWIYKLPLYTSLGEFADNLREMLSYSYPGCTRVDIVAETNQKVDTLISHEPTTLFVHVNSVQAIPKVCGEYHYSLPFTLQGGAYGKTSEQFKRTTRLVVSETFPCKSTRQVVVSKAEKVLTPIENSIDDVDRRIALLQAEILKHDRGESDTKTLTHVLKGSVDTHVHGGVPELIATFLDPNVVISNANGEYSPDTGHAIQQRLRSKLYTFIQCCLQVLLISKETFRRRNSIVMPEYISNLSPLQAEFEKSFIQMVSLISSHLEDYDFDFTDLYKTMETKLC